MSVIESKPWFHSNRYAADTACEHCGGIVRHEPWCINQNSHVLKAWEAVRDADSLDLHDHLILHALGVAWKNPCAGNCKP
jgi:hypothetical protein